jgi:hypothetical protein
MMLNEDERFNKLDSGVKLKITVQQQIILQVDHTLASGLLSLFLSSCVFWFGQPIGRMFDQEVESVKFSLVESG